MGNYSPDRSTIVTNDNGNSVNIPTSDLSRVIPRQLSTGTLRGTQNVGYGTAKIDGSNNRITVGAPDGSIVGIGQIPNSNPAQYGNFLIYPSGKLSLTQISGDTTQYDTNGVPRIFTGSNPSDGEFVMKISKPNIDVLTATDDKLIFNSNQNVFKIIKTDTVTITHPINTATTTLSVPNTLGFIPMFLAYATVDGGLSYDQLPLSSVNSVAGSLTINRLIDMGIDINNLYFQIKTGSNNIAPYTANIKYYLLQETAN